MSGNSTTSVSTLRENMWSDSVITKHCLLSAPPALLSSAWLYLAVTVSLHMFSLNVLTLVVLLPDIYMLLTDTCLLSCYHLSPAWYHPPIMLSPIIPHDIVDSYNYHDSGNDDLTSCLHLDIFQYKPYSWHTCTPDTPDMFLLIPVIW